MALFNRTPAITPEEAARRLAAGELALVDVREPHELLDGRVEGAANVPLGQLAARLGGLDVHVAHPAPGGPVTGPCAGSQQVANLSPNRRV